jgi:hypothetical protein
MIPKTSPHFPQKIGLTIVFCLIHSQAFFGQQKPDGQGTGGVSTGTPVNYMARRTLGITDRLYKIKRDYQGAVETFGKILEKLIQKISERITI